MVFIFQRAIDIMNISGINSVNIEYIHPCLGQRDQEGDLSVGETRNIDSFQGGATNARGQASSSNTEYKLHNRQYSFALWVTWQ